MYSKPHLSIPEQIVLLQSRNLIIENKELATRFLGQIGYERFRNYSLTFRQQDKTTNRPIMQYRENSTFEAVKSLYDYDAKLRVSTMSVVNEMETSVATAIAYILGSIDPYAHLSPSKLNESYCLEPNMSDRSVTNYAFWRRSYDDKQSRSVNKRSNGELFKLLSRDENADIPIWLAIEFMDFGNISHLFKMLRPSTQLAVMQHLGLSLTAGDFSDYFRAFNTIRNNCAHNSLLFASKYDFVPIEPLKHIVALKHIYDLARIKSLGRGNTDVRVNGSIYAMFAIAKFILRESKSDELNTIVLRDCLSAVDNLPFSAVPRKAVRLQMGIPTQWDFQSIWQD